MANSKAGERIAGPAGSRYKWEKSGVGKEQGENKGRRILGAGRPPRHGVRVKGTMFRREGKSPEARCN